MTPKLGQIYPKVTKNVHNGAPYSTKKEPHFLSNAILATPRKKNGPAHSLQMHARFSTVWTDVGLAVLLP